MAADGHATLGGGGESQGSPQREGCSPQDAKEGTVPGFTLVTLEGGAFLDLPVRTPPHHHLLPSSLPVTLAPPVSASRAAGGPVWTWCTPLGLEEELPVGAAGRAGTLRGRERVIVEQLQGGAGVVATLRAALFIQNWL